MRKLTVFAITLVFILLSCSNGDMEKEQPIDNSGSPLIGTWEGQNESGTHSKLTITLTEYTWELSFDPPIILAARKWTYDDTHFITLNGKDRYPLPYRFENGVLIILYLMGGEFYHNKID